MLFALFVAVFLLLWGFLTLVLPPAWRLLAAVSNRAAATSMRYGIVRRAVHAAGPFRDYLPVIILIAAGALIAGMAGDGFLDLAERVRANSPALEHFDQFVHDWAVARRENPATLFFDVMSTVGGPAGLAVEGGANRPGSASIADSNGRVSTISWSPRSALNPVMPATRSRMTFSFSVDGGDSTR